MLFLCLLLLLTGCSQTQYDTEKIEVYALDNGSYRCEDSRIVESPDQCITIDYPDLPEPQLSEEDNYNLIFISKNTDLTQLNLNLNDLDENYGNDKIYKLNKDDLKEEDISKGVIKINKFSAMNKVNFDNILSEIILFEDDNSAKNYFEYLKKIYLESQETDHTYLYPENINVGETDSFLLLYPIKTKTDYSFSFLFFRKNNFIYSLSLNGFSRNDKINTPEDIFQLNQYYSDKIISKIQNKIEHEIPIGETEQNNVPINSAKAQRNCEDDDTILIQIDIEETYLNWDELNNEGSFSFNYGVKNDGCVVVNGNFDLNGIDVTEKIEVYENNNLIHGYYYPFVFSLKLGKEISGIQSIIDSEGFSKTGSMIFFVKDKTQTYKIKYYLLNGKYDYGGDMSEYPILASDESGLIKEQ